MCEHNAFFSFILDNGFGYQIPCFCLSSSVPSFTLFCLVVEHLYIFIIVNYDLYLN